MERFLPGPLRMSSLGEQWPFPYSTYQQVERHVQSTSSNCAGLKIAQHSPQQEGSVAFPLLIIEWTSSHRTTDPRLRQIPLIAQFTAALLSHSHLWHHLAQEDGDKQCRSSTAGFAGAVTSRHLISASCGYSHTCLQLLRTRGDL